MGAPAQGRERLLAAFLLVLFVKAQETPGREAQAPKERGRAARVLSKDKIRAFKDLAGAGRKVTRVAKRRGDDPQTG